MDSARHFIRMPYNSTKVQNAVDDVASAIHQSLPAGEGAGGAGARQRVR
jgi:hypothetical protein